MITEERGTMAEDVAVAPSGRPKWVVAVVVALVLGAAWGVQRWRWSSTHASTDDVIGTLLM